MICPLIIDVVVDEDVFDVDIDDDSIDIDMGDCTINVNSIIGERYTGDYVVDPTFTPVVLETNNKVMTDDVTVNPILVSQVSNPSGGYTVYIGVV